MAGTTTKQIRQDAHRTYFPQYITDAPLSGVAARVSVNLLPCNKRRGLLTTRNQTNLLCMISTPRAWTSSVSSSLQVGNGRRRTAKSFKGRSTLCSKRASGTGRLKSRADPTNTPIVL